MALVPESVRRLFSRIFSLAGKEASALEELHEESKATVRRMAEKDPGLQQVLDNAHAYAVFPAVGKATAVVGGAFGRGEVFQGRELVGYAGLVQLTLGVQVGGQTFSEIVVLEDKEALDRFKAGRTAFAANASAVLVKAGAAASAGYDSGAMVFISTEGGMMLEAAIGAQKFLFKPAALGRTKAAPKNAGKSGAAAKGKTNPRRKRAAGKNAEPAPKGSKPRAAAGNSRSQTARTGRRSPSSPRPGRAGEERRRRRRDGGA